MEKSVRKAVRCYLIEDEKIVVTKYNEPNKKAGYYEIPGGKIEDGELPEETEENKSEWIKINELLNEDKILASIRILEKEYIKGLIDDNYTFNMHIKVDEQEHILDINYKINERYK